MMYIASIVFNVILPLLILMGGGLVLQRKFKLDMKSLSKLILYYYIPALTFVKIYESKLSLHFLVHIVGFLVLQFLCMLTIGILISRVMRYPRRMSSSFLNSVILTNNGNIGIPVNQLAFHQNPLAMATQIIVVIFELLLTFTFGLINASSARVGLRSTFMQFVKTPVLAALLLGFLCNIFHIHIPMFIWQPLKVSSDGMLSFALVSLGAQMASVRLSRNNMTVILSIMTRLCIGPVCAFGIIQILGLSGVTAQALLVASSIPTSRNSAALALEYGNDPEFAAEAVMASTICSTVTVTLVIYVATYLL